MKFLGVVHELEVRSGLKNPAQPDPGPRVLKPDPARARPINLICRPEPEANPKFLYFICEDSGGGGVIYDNKLKP